VTQPVLAIDIGGTKSIVALCRSDGQILDSIRADRPNGKDAFWIRDSIYERIETLKAKHSEVFNQIKHCGVGFGGPVRNNHPVVSIHIKGWEEIDLCAEVEARYGLAGCMENDGITQALGEHTFGAGKGRSSLIFANLGTGYGGGVIEDGKPRLGDGGFAGHFGHVCVVPNGRLCPCGNRGCAEAYCSGTGIGERARESAACGDPAAGPLAERIAQLPEGAGAGPEVLELAREGDPFALSLVEETLDLLSLALSAGVNILDIRLIVIGGGAGIGLAPWFPRLEKKVKARSLSLCREGLEVRPAGLGVNTVLLGAVALCGLRLSPK